MEFENEADRDHYTHKYPVHAAFGQSIGGVVQRAVMVDFVPEVF